MMVGKNLHQKSLFLITTSSAHPNTRSSWKLTEATNNPTRIPTSSDPAEGSFRPSIDVAGFILSTSVRVLEDERYQICSPKLRTSVVLRCGDGEDVR